MNTTPQKKPGSKKSRRAEYDAVAGSNNATGAGNKRRQSNIERKEETGAQGLLKPYDRLNLLNLCRDIERNYSQATAMFRQIRINIIGPSPKVQINTKDDFGKQSTSWINSKWMKACDFRGNRRFAKLAQLQETAKKREGDLLVAFDDQLILDTGKILFYEADQICDVTGGITQTFEERGYTQQDGIVMDKYGREVGVVATHRRGQTSVPEEDATIFPIDPDDDSNNYVNLIRSEFRLIQGRGIGPLAAAISDFLDCYEMRSKELQSAKKAASIYGFVKRAEAIENFDDPLMDPDNQNPTDQGSGYEGTDITLPEEQTEPSNYESLEKLTGGYTDYMDPDDTVEFPDINRPNVAMKEFLDYVMDSGGAAFGMAHAYTRLKADSSYTSFRGDMVLTWQSFYCDQKDAEHDFLDWCVIRAIRWAIRKGIITAEAPDDWETKLSWTLPKMPHVDELKERKATEQALKNGETTFLQILGPDYEEKWTQFSEELEKARELLLPLGVFETKAGAVQEDENEENKQENENEQD